MPLTTDRQELVAKDRLAGPDAGARLRAVPGAGETSSATTAQRLIGSNSLALSRADRGAVVALDARLREGRPRFGTEPRRWLPVRVRHVRRGPFDVEALVEDPADAYGLLVLDGLIAVGLDAGHAQVSWLIGSDDLLRPWDLAETSLTKESTWRALNVTRVAILDRDFKCRAGGSPRLADTLVRRAAQTSHWLFAMSLVLSTPRVEERVLLLFALLAERWGRVTPEGVCLELPLTHELLARLLGARRPSVTLALKALQKAGIVECRHRGSWLLHRCPPSPAHARRWATNACWDRYADAIGLADAVGQSEQA